MATSSNQPDENIMTIGTSKPGNKIFSELDKGHIEAAKLHTPQGRSLKHRESQKKREKEKDTSNTKLKESTSKGGDIHVSEDDVTFPPSRISSMRSAESSQQGNSYGEDHESDGMWFMWSPLIGKIITGDTYPFIKQLSEEIGRSPEVSCTTIDTLSQPISTNIQRQLFS